MKSLFATVFRKLFRKKRIPQSERTPEQRIKDARGHTMYGGRIEK